MYLQSLNTGQFCNYILIGDFNVNFCNENHSYYSRLFNTFSSLGLTQAVTEPTHIGPNGSTSMIDLVGSTSMIDLGARNRLGWFHSCIGLNPNSSTVVILENPKNSGKLSNTLLKIIAQSRPFPMMVEWPTQTKDKAEMLSDFFST